MERAVWSNGEELVLWLVCSLQPDFLLCVQVRNAAAWRKAGSTPGSQREKVLSSTLLWATASANEWQPHRDTTAILDKSVLPLSLSPSYSLSCSLQFGLEEWVVMATPHCKAPGDCGIDRRAVLTLLLAAVWALLPFPPSLPLVFLSFLSDPSRSLTHIIRYCWVKHYSGHLASWRTHAFLPSQRCLFKDLHNCGVENRHGNPKHCTDQWNDQIKMAHCWGKVPLCRSPVTQHNTNI